MNRKYGIGAVTKYSDNWHPRTASAWQRERTRGEILPMIPDQKPFFSRIMGLVGRGR